MRSKIAAAVAVLFIALASLVVTLTATSGATVQITSSSFVPPVVTISIRSVVTWTNTSSLSHTVTAERGEFSSGVIPPGGVYTHIFAAPGEYPYRDLLSPATGKVVVREGIWRCYLPVVISGEGGGEW